MAVGPGSTYRVETLMEPDYDLSISNAWIKVEVLPQASNGALTDDPKFDGPHKMHGAGPKVPGQKAPIFDW